MSSDADHRNPSHPAGRSSRPALVPELSPTEFGRWHWWKDELVDYCRQHGLAVSGTKSMLIDRITGHLTDHTFDLIAGANREETDTHPDPPSAASASGPVSTDQLYLVFARRYFDEHPDATLREAWRSFKWTRASGRIPVGAS